MTHNKSPSSDSVNSHLPWVLWSHTLSHIMHWSWASTTSVYRLPHHVMRCIIFSSPYCRRQERSSNLPKVTQLKSMYKQTQDPKPSISAQSPSLQPPYGMLPLIASSILQADFENWPFLLPIPEEPMNFLYHNVLDSCCWLYRSSASPVLGGKWHAYGN